jgi:hypothetical protein
MARAPRTAAASGSETVSTMARGKRRGMPPPPSCKAILLCERVVYNAFTQRYSVVEIIGDIYIDRPNYPFGPCSLFLEITNAVGVHHVVPEIHDLGSGDVIARGEPVRVEMLDRLERHTVVLTVPAFEIPGPGSYDILALANDQEINRQTILVRSIEEGDDVETDEAE